MTKNNLNFIARVFEAKTRASLSAPAKALATDMNTSFLNGLYKNQATLDTYM